MSAKKFLILFFSVYIGVALVANVLLGPPGQSSAYLEKYKDDHEQYLETIKSAPYKHLEQLHRAGVEESVALDRIYAADAGKGLHDELTVDPPRAEFENSLPFARAYAAREEYQAEAQRMSRYALFFDFYNSISFILLVFWFARKPFGTFVDGQIERVRGRIERATRAREEAARRLHEAQAKLEGLDAERRFLDEQVERVIGQEVAEIHQGTADTLAQIDAETEARKSVEEQAAMMRVKRELVNQALKEITIRLQQSVSQKHQTALIDQFAKEIDGLGQTSGGHAHG